MKEAKPYFRDALIAFGRMSGWIAGPVILALILGKWLDRVYGTEPYLFIAIIGLGFFLSVFGILRETKRYIRSVEEKDKKNTMNSVKNESEIIKN
jgi:F0F1-type ATP synthase assembly protein I